MSEDKWEKMRELLDCEYDFPADYLFKFIVPNTQVDNILGLLGDLEVSTRPSSKGKYVAVTAKKKCAGPEEIVKIYESVSKIEGIMTL